MTTLADDTVMATLSLRSNFAIHHLRAATKAARDAYRVEQDNLDAEFGPWFDDLMLSVPVSIAMAGAALEASANELIQDLLDGHAHSPLTGSRKQLLTDLKEDHSGNAPLKLRRLALLM